jgi:hypothetical protein
MEPLKSFLLFLAGAALASALFIFGVDRGLPHWLAFWREEPLALTVDAPFVPPDAQGCQQTYAIDNRTDQKLFLTMNAATPPPYDPYAPDRESAYRPYAPPDYKSDVSRDDSDVSLPESELPSIAPPDDHGDGATQDSDTTYGSGAYEQPPRRNYGAPTGYGMQTDYGPQQGYGSPGGYAAPASRSYDVPPTPYPSPDVGPPSPDYPPPGSDQGVSLVPPAVGPGPSEIKPGQIYFPTTEGGCDDAAHTVTIELRDKDRAEDRYEGRYQRR